MHCQCKVILYFMSYKDSGVKWTYVAEYMIVIGWQCKIILHCQYIQIKSIIYYDVCIVFIFDLLIDRLYILKSIYIL
jgi:hypothetical protein